MYSIQRDTPKKTSPHLGPACFLVSPVQFNTVQKVSPHSLLLGCFQYAWPCDLLQIHRLIGEMGTGGSFYSFLAWANLRSQRIVPSYFPVIRKAGASLVTEDFHSQNYPRTQCLYKSQNLFSTPGSPWCCPWGLPSLGGMLQMRAVENQACSHSQGG